MTTIGMMMPADMGGAVARMLRERDTRVVTNLAGRSARTRRLAAASGAEDLGDDGAVVRASDIILSIVTPDAAVALSERLAWAIRAGETAPLYLDCNAIAPATARSVADIVERAGGRFVDAGIIGNPPRHDPREARVYISGPHAAEAARLLGEGVDTRIVSDRVGDASAVKMCYAALTKGSMALMGQLIVAAERLGILKPLVAEFGFSQPEQLARLRRTVPASVPKAFRWVAEMEEIGRTMAEAGLTAKSFEGAAEHFSAVAGTDLGRLRVEEWANAPPSFEEVVRRLALKMGLDDDR